MRFVNPGNPVSFCPVILPCEEFPLGEEKEMLRKCRMALVLSRLEFGQSDIKHFSRGECGGVVRENCRAGAECPAIPVL